MSKLAVSIMVDSADAALSNAAIAAERGAELVEYRFDRFTDDLLAVTNVVDRSPLPCIVTCRPTWEGGEYTGDESSRMRVFAAASASEHPPAYLDIELAAYQRSATVRQAINPLVDHPGSIGSVSTGLILSSHDFEGRPPDLLQRVEAMANIAACRVIKLAWHARSLRANLEAFELLAASHKPTIALCMGEFGLMSRVLAGKYSALLTFAGLDDDTVTAPGQVGVAKLRDLYRWDAINPETGVYGVIGWPVGHSMSPHIHNSGFAAVEHDGVYLPLPIPPEYEHFKATMHALLDDPLLNFRGASVTIPHKQNLLRFVEERGGEIESLAQTIGAANTLTISPSGRIRASNTDCDAAIDAICIGLGVDRGGLCGKRAAVIGAGGAARAVVAGLAHYGAFCTIYNRTVEKAEALAESLARPGAPVVAAPMSELAATEATIIVNCTPIGMSPNVDASPLDPFPVDLPTETLVFDTIYNPPQTKLLRDAEAVGHKTVSGVEMFTRQAAVQFKQWTDRDAPIELFDSVVRANLNSN